MSSPEKAQTWHRIACVHSMPHLPAKHRHILDETTSGPSRLVIKMSNQPSAIGFSLAICG